MIIAFEGMDGCGKSSVARTFASKNDFQFIERPNRVVFGMNPSQYGDLCDKLCEYDNSNVLAMFFGFGNIFQTTLAGNLALDRHILSNYYWNGTEENKCLFETFVKLCPSDVVNIILYASPEVRRQRVFDRDPSDPDLNNEKAFAFGYDKMIEFANDTKMKYLVVNTSEHTLDSLNDYVQALYDTIKSMNEKELRVFCNKHNAPVLEGIANECMSLGVKTV